MFPSHSPQQSVIGAQLVAELLAYERGLAQLLQQRWDPDLYRVLSDRFDRMQMYANSLPGLASEWTELLISRVELAQALWTLRTPSRVDGKVVAMYAQHRTLLHRMLRECARFALPTDRAHAAGAQDGEAPTRPPA
jgi:hypothetical protein